MYVSFSCQDNIQSTAYEICDTRYTMMKGHSLFDFQHRALSPAHINLRCYKINDLLPRRWEVYRIPVCISHINWATFLKIRRQMWLHRLARI